MFILYITSRYSHFNILFSKPCQRQYELLPSLGVGRLSSIDTSYQVSVHFAKRLQKRRIFKISQSETRVAYGRYEK
jgi:hypothetical protein